MPSTTFVDATFSARGIGNRTTAAGAAVGDISAEEDRLVNLLTEGKVSNNAFAASVSGMTVTIGSGSAKADVYAVAGDIAGQGVYLVRLDDVSAAVTIDAADASQQRIDEIYLVVEDSAYDGGTRSLPRIGYRKGDAGGSAPGPDAAWDASALLHTVTVPAAAASLTAGDLTDQRASAQLAVDAATLDGLSESAFFRAANHTKATHDALNIDADTLDGLDSTAFAASGHTHAQRHIEARKVTASGGVATVTFTTAFATVPVVVATPLADPSAAKLFSVAVHSITTTGCTVEVHSVGDGPEVDVQSESVPITVIATEAT